MTVELMLAVLVGLVTGVLIALWWDSQTLMRRLQAAQAERQRAQASLQKFQIQHTAVEQQLKLTQKELTTAVAENTQFEDTIARQLAEIEAGREQVQVSIKANDALKEELQALQDRLEELEGLQVRAEEKAGTAVAENNRLIGDVQLMEAEIATLESKIEQLTQAEAQSPPRLPDLEQNVLAAQAQLAAVEAERDAAQTQLEQVELASAEQKAQIDTLKQQVQAAEKVKQELAVAQEKLQTADVHIQKLQDTMDDVKIKMNYSGKNQLQLIRGIGPTYARRLNEFGIQTFTDLAECQPDQIASIIKKKEWQAVNIQDWLDEAKALAARLGPDG